jgi:hypothetical protein
MQLPCSHFPNSALHEALMLLLLLSDDMQSPFRRLQLLLVHAAAVPAAWCMLLLASAEQVLTLMDRMNLSASRRAAVA